jgi:hypothetical protein
MEQECPSYESHFSNGLKKTDKHWAVCDIPGMSRQFLYRSIVTILLLVVVGGVMAADERPDANRTLATDAE